MLCLEVDIVFLSGASMVDDLGHIPALQSLGDGLTNTAKAKETDDGIANLLTHHPVDLLDFPLGPVNIFILYYVFI